MLESILPWMACLGFRRQCPIQSLISRIGCRSLGDTRVNRLRGLLVCSLFQVSKLVSKETIWKQENGANIQTGESINWSVLRWRASQREMAKSPQISTWCFDPSLRGFCALTIHHPTPYSRLRNSSLLPTSFTQAENATG